MHGGKISLSVFLHPTRQIVSIVCNGSKACIRDKGNTVSRNLDRGILYQPSLATPRHEIIGSLRTPLDDEESIAPSWSWVSNPNPVKWGGETNNFDPLFMCQSKIASINMKTNLNPYGQVQKGSNISHCSLSFTLQFLRP